MGKPHKDRIRHHYKPARLAKIKTTDETKIETHIITVVGKASLYVYSRRACKFLDKNLTM